jgi:hypothetical protein
MASARDQRIAEICSSVRIWCCVFPSQQTLNRLALDELEDDQMPAR